MTTMFRRSFILILSLVIAFAAGASAEKPEPTFANVAYAAHEQSVLDFWQADSDTPTPLVIFIHGGGFSLGSKDGASGSHIKKCLENGISYASIDYPFYKDLPLLEIIRDNIARSVQFLRYKAADWNIDPEKVVVYGGSAGAGSSLWIAFHDDLADPDNEDPVLRESTRVLAAGALSTQATYDLPLWFKIFKDEIGSQQIRFWRSVFTPMILDMYHMETEEELKTERGKKIRRALNMLAMMDKNDPPVYMKTMQDNNKHGDILHHPGHPRTVKARCDKLGMECVAILLDTPEEERTEVIDFLFKYIKS